MNKKTLLLSYFYKTTCIVLLAFLFYTCALNFFVHNPKLNFAEGYDRPIADEYWWYHGSYHYNLFFKQHAYFHYDWKRGLSAFDQTNMVKFFLSFFLSIHGIELNTHFDNLEGWYYDTNNWQPNTSLVATRFDLGEEYYHHHLTFPQEALFIGRYYCAVFGYLALAACCLYCIRITNLLFGTLFSCYLSRFLFFYNTYMLSELFVLFFYALSLLFFDYTYKSRTLHGRIITFLLYSVVAGITMGIKQTCFLVIFFYPTYALIKIICGINKKSRRMDILLFFLHIVIVAFIFLMLHPQTYGNPLGGIYAFLETGQSFIPKSTNILLGALKMFSLQIDIISRTIQNIFHFRYVLVIVLLLFGRGLVGIFNITTLTKARLFLRFIPLALMVIIMPLCFSSLCALVKNEMVPYTWPLTIVMSLIIWYGAFCVSLQIGGFCKTYVLNILRNKK